MHEVTLVVEGRCFLEGPRWRGDALYVSDMRADEVLRITLEGDVEVLASVDDPCGIGWLPDGRMLVNSMAPRKIMRLEPDGAVVEHADCAPFAAFPINDMVTDRDGRAYVGHWGYDVFGGVEPVPVPLLRVEPDGRVSEAGGEILLANGITLTADGSTLIVVETLGGRLTAFDVAADGSISNSRLWAALDATRPDGICIDVEDGVWLGDYGDDRFVRVVEGGEVTEVVEVPGRTAIACALGGDDGHTLVLITTTGRTDREGARIDRGARVETTRVSIPGCERP